MLASTCARMSQFSFLALRESFFLLTIYRNIQAADADCLAFHCSEVAFTVASTLRTYYLRYPESVSPSFTPASFFRARIAGLGLHQFPRDSTSTLRLSQPYFAVALLLRD